ncbi:MAG: 30S ribosome-binding factor RbfA [Phycisphaerales bacterium]|jgi:ribosome-binding factor A|nr:30S ribosome-binding factor RbfA [Phycisphaerales bacterium]MBT7170369.1 30S ribosome-binding factor RbfA [Phycisphaerales bacterium]
MTMRTQRVGNLLRNTLGQLLLRGLADPRFDSATTTLTRVEVTEDLLTAKVFLSIRGDEKHINQTLSALRNASGHLQSRMVEGMRLRHTPRLQFVIDEQHIKTMDTLAIMAEVSRELREAEEKRANQPESPSEEDES